MSFRRRRLRPAATRIALVKKYLASNLTLKAFCQREKLAYSTFLSWLRKYRAAQSDSPRSSGTASGFVPLQVQLPSPAFCTLEYPNGVLIHFSSAVDAQVLAPLLGVLGEKP